MNEPEDNIWISSKMALPFVIPRPRVPTIALSELDASFIRLIAISQSSASVVTTEVPVQS